MLFWETNKRSNVLPRETWGPSGCHASRQMWQTDELGFTTEQERDETPAWGGAATGVHVCECHCVHVWLCVCVCERVSEIRFFRGWRWVYGAAVPSGHNITTKTGMTTGRVTDDDLLLSLIWSSKSEQVCSLLIWLEFSSLLDEIKWNLLSLISEQQWGIFPWASAVNVFGLSKRCLINHRALSKTLCCCSVYYSSPAPSLLSLALCRAY